MSCIRKFAMGRSAKFMKRPTQKERETRKRVKAAAKPLSPPPKDEPAEDREAKVKAKKRKMMRAKADKVGGGEGGDGERRWEGGRGWGEEREARMEGAGWKGRA